MPLPVRQSASEQIKAIIAACARMRDMRLNESWTGRIWDHHSGFSERSCMIWRLSQHISLLTISLSEFCHTTISIKVCYVLLKSSYYPKYCKSNMLLRDACRITKSIFHRRDLMRTFPKFLYCIGICQP